MSLLALSDLRALATGLDHAESVCWDPGRGCVYAGGEAGQLYRCRLDTSPVELERTIAGGSLLGLALDGDGALYACDPGNHCVHRIADPGASPVPVGPRMTYPNELAFDRTGCLWISDSGAWGARNGRLLKVDSRGEVSEVGTALAFSNGLAIDESHLYYVESGTGTVSRIALQGGEPDPVCVLPRTVPDGLAFDCEGGLWVSCFQPNQVYRVDPSGTCTLMLDDWSGEELLSPTNLAFAGADLDRLVLASLCGHEIKVIEPGVRGRDLYFPKWGISTDAGTL